MSNNKFLNLFIEDRFAVPQRSAERSGPRNSNKGYSPANPLQALVWQRSFITFSESHQRHLVDAKRTRVAYEVATLEQLRSLPDNFTAAP